MTHLQKQQPSDTTISCLRFLSTEQLFRESLNKLYSEKYFKQYSAEFAEAIFIFQLKYRNRCWTVIKNNRELRSFIKTQEIYEKLSEVTHTAFQNQSEDRLQFQAQVFQNALGQFLTVSPEGCKLPFFQFEREGYGSFVMNKRSGGRYRESVCCKLGSLILRWKERIVYIYSKGVAYYNQKKEIRQFLSFGQSFHFVFGKPDTGLEFGIVLFANQRQLSLQAKSIKQFINFIFILRHACEQSSYMTLNRYNSFAPLRYSNSTKFFVDGEQYFQNLGESLLNAKKSVLIIGWVVSPEFLIKRESEKISFQNIVEKLSQKQVKISIIVYYQSSFLSNDSLYTKQKLQKFRNIVVLRHPCGKLPKLWSHHAKMVIIDEQHAFIGGLDITYGRFDCQSHQLFPNAKDYPGLQYNNIRKNDQYNARCPNQSNISKSQCRLPWHDIGQSLKGEVVTDLVHHFYQMWNFIRYENRVSPHDSFPASLLENDGKSVFSTKVIEKEENSILSKLGNRINNMKSKGNNVIEKIKTQLKKKIEGDFSQNGRGLRLSGTENYFDKYVDQIAIEIQHKNKGERTMGKKSSKFKNRSSRSKRYSVEDLKQVKQAISKKTRADKPHSFLLTGNKILDFMTIDIDQDYVDCLERIRNAKKSNQQQDCIKQIESDQESSTVLGMKYNEIVHSEGRDQCQAVRSVGNWSIGCHPNNTEFSIHIAYLQLISQAKHYMGEFQSSISSSILNQCKQLEYYCGCLWVDHQMFLLWQDDCDLPNMQILSQTTVLVHYIYIQNQFFISSLAGSDSIKNQIALALYLRIKKAIQTKENFKVIIILPLLPGFAGNLETEECLIMRKEMQWQYNTICRGQNSLWQKLLSHTNDPSKYLQFLSLRTHGKSSPQAEPQTEIIYVHAKLMIIDDETILCGSANINDRSLSGDRDSQLCVITRGDEFVEGRMNGEPLLVSQMAQELRIKLWKEHFAFAEQELLDPTSNELWERIMERASNNTNIYRKIFGCYPDDNMKLKKDIKALRMQSKIQLYEQLKKEIQGHVVQFPLHFLQGEQLTLLITQKQFYMPQSCLT